MTTQARNYKGNVVATTLAGAINASATTVNVADGSTYPASNFWIVIDQDTASEEKIFVTTRVNSVFTVVRGGDNTAASAHDVSAPVSHVLVANDVQQLNDHATDNTNDVHSQYLLKTSATSAYLTQANAVTAYEPKRTIASQLVTTNATTTSGTVGDLAGSAGPAVTVTVPSSGVVNVTINGIIGTSAANVYAQMGFALSGANTSTYDSSRQIYCASQAGSVEIQTGATYRLSGLTPGSTTFTAKYVKGGGAGTANYSQRMLTVETLP